MNKWLIWDSTLFSVKKLNICLCDICTTHMELAWIQKQLSILFLFILFKGVGALLEHHYLTKLYLFYFRLVSVKRCETWETRPGSDSNPGPIALLRSMWSVHTNYIIFMNLLCWCFLVTVVALTCMGGGNVN